MTSGVGYSKVHTVILKTIYSGLFLATALLLPFLTGQVPHIGSMLCPMHLPVIICGFFCGWQYGLAVGFASPLMRFIIFGMPPVFPTGLAMAIELAVYGALAGVFFRIFPKKIPYLYISLLLSMIAGRAVWGAVRFVFAGIGNTTFPFSAFFAGAVVNSLPGIILQILFIPPIVLLLEKIQKRT